MDASLAILVYSIWKNRNSVVWDGKIGRPESVLSRCAKALKVRVLHLKPKKLSDMDDTWIKNIGLISYGQL